MRVGVVVLFIFFFVRKLHSFRQKEFDYGEFQILKCGKKGKKYLLSKEWFPHSFSERETWTGSVPEDR